MAVYVRHQDWLGLTGQFRSSPSPSIYMRRRHKRMRMSVQIVLTLSAQSLKRWSTIPAHPFALERIVTPIGGQVPQYFLRVGIF
jgi:hypothetical protein